MAAAIGVAPMPKRHPQTKRWKATLLQMEEAGSYSEKLPIDTPRALS
jgi:hypothetical protein